MSPPPDMTQNDHEKTTDTERPFLSHLVELRDRLLRALIVVGIVLLVLLPFANTLYTLLATPLLESLPAGHSMVAIDVASPFLAPFKLTLLLALTLTVPYTLYQIWAFAAPGLYGHEKRLAAPILLSSVALFYLGMVFAYFVVFPLVFGFFVSTAPEGVAVMTDINRFLDFVVKIFLAFGVAFEVPIVTVAMVVMGATTPKRLQEIRPYVIVGAFVIGMLLTPPDVISQTLLAVPVWLLYEIGILFSKMVAPKATETAQPESRFRPMSEAEMDAELDAMESTESPPKSPDVPPEERKADD